MSKDDFRTRDLTGEFLTDAVDFEAVESGLFKTLTERDITVRSELEETREHLRRVVSGYFRDTGHEPSVSVLGRAASEARDYFIEQGKGCPNCPDQGWYVVASIYTGEAEQEQCEFCETDPESKFNRRKLIA